MPTYRSDVVGSLLRPTGLLDARKQYEAGAMAVAAFKKIEDRAVDDAIALQTRAGLDVVSGSSFWPTRSGFVCQGAG